ncbi:MAG: hypothetical protein JWL63_3368 [Rhodocyclales bacterium]|nr:hypothetical protein [Rhodocyclales bacterium]
MDSVVAQLLARLSMFLTQELDLQVDTQRFGDDAEYATQVLELVDEMDDHEFKMVAEQIRKRLLQLLSLKAISSANTTGDSPSVNPDTRPTLDKRI